MKRFVLIILLLAGLGVGAKSFALLTTSPEGYALPFYWVRGTVTSLETGEPLPNRSVAFYKDFSQKVEVPTDSAGSYEVNAYDLYYRFGIPVTPEGETYKIAVPRVRTDDWGTEESVALVTTEGYVTKNLAAIQGGGPLESGNIPAGSTIFNTRVLLEGFFPRPDIPTMQWSIPQTQPTIVFELRSAELGAIVATSAPCLLMADGWGTLYFSPEVFGVQAGSPGNYGIVIYQRIRNTGVAVADGFNHLPVITSAAVNLIPGATYDLNFADPNSTEFQPLYFPAGLVPATKEAGGLYALRVGHVANSKIVGPGDINIVTDQIKKAGASAAIDLNDPNSVLSDLNGDNRIDLKDYNLCRDTLGKFGSQREDHIYVP